MRNLISGLIALVILALVLSFSKSNDVKDTGALGDVKYSVLDPTEFAKQNGPGWVLLSGTSLKEVDSMYQSSALKGIIQIPSLPDARGVFIRGMNEGRSIDSGDVDGGDDRKVGSFQRDAFASHNHEIYAGVDGQKRRIMASLGWSGGWGNQGNVSPVHAEKVPNTVNESGLISIRNSGGTETRPRNIALYVYIKIN